MKYSILSVVTLLATCQANAVSFPDQPLTHYQCPDCGKLSKETLSTSWLIDDKDIVPADFKPVISKKYYRKVTGAALKDGIELGILAEQAVVRLSPAKSVSLANHWQDKLSIQMEGKTYPLAQQVQLQQDETAFKRQFDVGSALIFQLKPGVIGKRPQLILVDDSIADDSVWLLNVYDRRSDLYLSVSLDKMQYRYGDGIQANIEVGHDYSLPEINWIEARILGPTGDGKLVPLQHDGGYHYHGETPVTNKTMKKGENWYFEVMSDMTINGQHSIRVATAAFSYVVPSAKLVSLYQAKSVGVMAFTASIDAIQASRYQLQGVLFATGDDGVLHSVALAQSSAWLDAGRSDMTLKFEQALPANRHAPYYIGQLELVDDMQLKPVYRYAEKIPLSQLEVE